MFPARALAKTQIDNTREDMREVLSRLVDEKHLLVGQIMVYDVSKERHAADMHFDDGASTIAIAAVPPLMLRSNGAAIAEMTDSVRTVAALTRGTEVPDHGTIGERLVAYLICHPEAFAEITSVDTALELAARPITNTL